MRSDFQKAASYLLDHATTKLDHVTKKKILYNDTVITFDIESTSYSIPAPEHDIQQAECYIWQLSVDGIVFYGRELYQFFEVLKDMKARNLGRVVIFVHNLGFEFGFLQSFASDWQVFARAPHKPMKAVSEEFNVEFRCSYHLYNMSLENCAKSKKLKVQKLVGDLDYSLIRTPITPLTDQELAYCENDVLILDELIRSELPEYESPVKIPLTQTGRPRRRLQKIYSKNYGYHLKVRKMYPRTPEVYNEIIWTLMGGYTHPNATYTGDILNNVWQYDIASSYPYVMVSEKFPRGFYKYTIKDVSQIDYKDAWLLHLKFKNIYCMTQNTYISYHKCKASDPVLDNGRVVSADSLTIRVTELDWLIIKHSYHFDDVEILSSYRAKKDYLDINYVNLILLMYSDKTTLKGIPEEEDTYRRQKEQLNALFGLTLTNNIKDEVIFDKDWKIKRITDEDVAELLEKTRMSWNTILTPQVGLYVTAAARFNLWKMILANDDIVIYVDTDSLKTLGKPRGVKEYNNEVMKKLREVSKERKIPFSLFAPKDKDGKERPLGIFEFEGIASEFIALGAKKYAYKDDSGYHVTVSGVNKKAASKWIGERGLEAFNKDTYFPPDVAGNMYVNYNTNQVPVEITDYLGNKWTTTNKTGVYMEPKGYQLNQTPDYLSFIDKQKMIYRRGLLPYSE